MGLTEAMDVCLVLVLFRVFMVTLTGMPCLFKSCQIPNRTVSSNATALNGGVHILVCLVPVLVCHCVDEGGCWDLFYLFIPANTREVVCIAF